MGWAWYRRADESLTPATGAGYGLGVAGALMMLALLLYPLRKRVGFMRGWGPASFWFRWHMILGVAGPALIIIHSDFDLNSVNATVALASMLAVAGSGLVGRYLYGRVHRGLYGRKLDAKALREEAAQSRAALAGLSATPPSWAAELSAFEASALAGAPTLISALSRAGALAGLAGRCRKEVIRRIDLQLAAEARAFGWDAARTRALRRQELVQLKRYFTAVRRAASLGVYERLLSLWHVLHVPLFLLLVLTAIIHVIAVHLY